METLADASDRSARLFIGGITPTVDDGAYKVKRIAGDVLTVEADVVGDGHNALAAELLYRAKSAPNWNRIPMRPIENDRWRGEVPLAAPGDYIFCIEAWVDEYASFTRDLRKKRAAGRDVALETVEGRLLIERARNGQRGLKRGALEAILSGLKVLSEDRRIELLLAEETRSALAAADPRSFLTRSPEQTVQVERERALFGSWYELFPRSQSDDPARHGTFRDCIARLPQIAELGFDVLYLTPIHPIGTTNRKGRNNALHAEPGEPGSSYAIGSSSGGHDAIDPQLGTLDDFRCLVTAARGYGMEIALDFALQCSPDHPWLREHPQWFDWRPNGSVKFAENPPKKYEDIVNFDFYRPAAIPDLWIALRDLVLFWMQQDVKVFRVDNPHTKPLPFWQWLISDIRRRDPDVIFLSEAFTRPKMMYQLAKIGFSQSYSYFTWRNTKRELTDYLTELTATEVREYFRPNFFVNTPDVNPFFLQTGGRPAFLIRAVLAATLSGSWGLYSGFEYCEADAVPGREEYQDSEKYEIKFRDWNNPNNIKPTIKALNHLRRSERALRSHLGLSFYNAFNDQILYYAKSAPGSRDRIAVILNLDPFNAQECDFEVPLWEWGLPDNSAVSVVDLIEGYRFDWHEKTQHIRLTPDYPYRIWRIRPPDGAPT